MSLLNHIGVLLLILVFLYLMDLFHEKRPYTFQSGLNKLVPATAAFIIFIIFEIIYWIIKIFF